MEAKESMKDYLTEVCSEKLINFIEDTNTDAESNLSLLDGAEGSCFDDFFDVGLDSFSKWAASKARSKNPLLGNVVYACTQFAVLEAAENIFHYGSGFTKLDLSGFTLKEILDIVKKIADDVEVILNAPQKETVSNFEATITMIKHDANEEAYDNLKLVKGRVKKK